MITLFWPKGFFACTKRDCVKVASRKKEEIVYREGGYALLVVVTTIFSRVKSKTGSSEASFDKWLLGKHFFHFKMVPTLVLLDKLYS